MKFIERADETQGLPRLPENEMTQVETSGEQPHSPIRNGGNGVAPPREAPAGAIDRAGTSTSDAANVEIGQTCKENVGANGASARQGATHLLGEFVIGAKDSTGRTIDFIYFKRHNYAIYRSDPEILVAHSDTSTEADQQIAAICGLLPLRDHLINLIKDLPPKSDKHFYLAHIADALRLGLEKQPEAAKAIIEQAAHEVMDMRERVGRMVYLYWAAGIALVVAGVLITLGGAYAKDISGVPLLLMATGAGAIGALLSIAIGIRGRTVAVEGNWRANAMDAAVRVLIGVISAGVLFLLLNTGVVTDLQAGGVKFTGADMKWQVAVLFGFAAGFLERLVPDLLEKSAPGSKPPATTPRTISDGVVSPSGAAGGRS
jgi:hypothetical protein